MRSRRSLNNTPNPDERSGHIHRQSRPPYHQVRWTIRNPRARPIGPAHSSPGKSRQFRNDICKRVRQQMLERYAAKNSKTITSHQHKGHIHGCTKMEGTSTIRCMRSYGGDPGERSLSGQVITALVGTRLPDRGVNGSLSTTENHRPGGSKGTI